MVLSRAGALGRIPPPIHRELDGMQGPLGELKALLGLGDATLLFGAHERGYNNAIVLAQHLREK